MSFFHNTNLIGASGQGGGAAGAYSIPRSLRFNSSDSAYLSRTPASAGNRKTWTWAGWVKRSALGAREGLISAQIGVGQLFFAGFVGTDDKFYIHNGVEGYSIDSWAVTTAIFRDPAAWYHIVLTIDTSQSTATDRVKLYVNGVQQTLNGFGGGNFYPIQNYDTAWNSNTLHELGYGHTNNGKTYSNCYLADIHFIDGQALDPTSFGEFDATTGVWNPIAYSGTYGTNGFHLPFSDNSAATATTLGKDSAGSNDWTPNNLSVTAGAGAGNYVKDLAATYASDLRISAFDGDTNTGVRALATAAPLVWSPNPGVSYSISVEIWDAWPQANEYWKINGGSKIYSPNGSAQWVTLASGSGTITSIENGYDATYRGGIYAIRVDGIILIDNTAPAVAGNDSLVDSPTSSGTDTGAGGEVVGNYATLNPLDKGSSQTVANGNLDISGSLIYGHTKSTLFVTSGKWYFEYILGTFQGDTAMGLANSSAALTTFSGENTSSVGYLADGRFFYNSSATSYSSYTTGDVIGVAFDCDTGKIWIAKNNTWQNSGNPAGGTGQVQTVSWANFTPIARTIGSGAISANFGARPFAYTAPSGFKALCTTTNLPEPTILKGSDYFDTKLYTGNGSTQTISGLDFSPDLVWIKSRSNATSHTLHDTIRGTQLEIYSDSASQEYPSANGLTAFNSNGFTLGTQDYYNGSGRTFAAWCWDAGTSTVSNTAGSITSTVRANASAGFSIVTYTTPGSLPGTIGHGLGVEPHMIITKSRGASGGWGVYHKSIGNTNLLLLNGTNASTSGPNQWNSTTPTSTIFSIGTDYPTSATYVAYCFAPVAGYSSFGSFSGGTNPNFVYLGFRPRYVMIKRTDTTNYWIIQDAARNTYNQVDLKLAANSSVAENDLGTLGDTTQNQLDFVSNGFVCRSTNGGTNASGGTYIYFALAESPFSIARAR